MARERKGGNEGTRILDPPPSPKPGERPYIQVRYARVKGAERERERERQRETERERERESVCVCVCEPARRCTMSDSQSKRGKGASSLRRKNRQRNILKESNNSKTSKVLRRNTRIRVRLDLRWQHTLRETLEWWLSKAARTCGVGQQRGAICETSAADLEARHMGLEGRRQGRERGGEGER